MVMGGDVCNQGCAQGCTKDLSPPSLSGAQKRMLVDDNYARIVITDQKLKTIKDVLVMVMGVVEAASKAGAPLAEVAPPPRTVSWLAAATVDARLASCDAPIHRLQ